MAALQDARKPRDAEAEAWPPRAAGRTYPFRAKAAVGFIAACLFVLQGFLITRSPSLPDTWVIVLVFDVWLALFALHVLLARTTVDERGIRVVSPVWRRSCPFHRIVTMSFQPLRHGGAVLVVVAGRGLRTETRFFSSSPEVDRAFERLAEHFGAE